MGKCILCVIIFFYFSFQVDKVTFVSKSQIESNYKRRILKCIVIDSVNYAYAKKGGDIYTRTIYKKNIDSILLTQFRESKPQEVFSFSVFCGVNRFDFLFKVK